MLKRKTKVFFSLLFIASLSSSCHSSGFELIEEKMYFDSSTNLRYQYVKFDSYQHITGLYEGTVETNILDSFQIPDSFKFGETNDLSINIPYDSSLSNFYFEARRFSFWNGRELQKKSNLTNCTNSRDDRKHYGQYSSFCIRYGKNNGSISDITNNLVINIIFSEKFMFDNLSNTYYTADGRDYPIFHLRIYFWDMLDNLIDFNYSTFDDDKYIDEMRLITKNIKENNLVKINAYWENGNRIENFEPLVDFDYFYYGPHDPTYEIVV